MKAAKVAKRRSPKPAAKPRAKPAVRARLRRYRAKRDFAVTAEPSGDAAVRPATGASFVIQKHAARRLHYDVRLELDGVLVSWAVPKGPSLVPGERRLAARVEDHPLDYADFEGIIPAGEYGGGTVVVWDRGTWTPDGDPREALARGRLTFDLAGEKLRGRWHLVRTKGDGKAERWLLFKGRDAAAVESGSIVDERPESVISGRTVEQVAEDRDRVWHSNRAELAPAPAAAALPTLHALVAALPTARPFTNLDKVLYPDQGLTKAQLIAYVAVTAEWSLPHLAGRPLTLVRCPNGAGAKCFFQKHAAESAPASIRRVAIAEDSGELADYMVIDDLEGVVATAQLGALELHTWGAHADQPERPDLLVFDLDPDPAVGWDAVVAGAIDVRDRLAAIELTSWVKTTGGKGLHVCVPIARTLGWDDVKAFTRAFAEHVVAAAPARYTANPLKARRKGKIFVDYLRNGRGATFIAPYSTRARPGAPIATPVSWDELERGVDPAAFTVLTVPRRLGALRADPWAGIGDTQPRITAAMRKAIGLG